MPDDNRFNLIGNSGAITFVSSNQNSGQIFHAPFFTIPAFNCWVRDIPPTSELDEFIDISYRLANRMDKLEKRREIMIFHEDDRGGLFVCFGGCDVTH